ncbi:hypothetical protein DYH56_05930 [Psychrilyobacter piezotolerans]|uniref:HNH nuclease domain-containing protein n=1 Tax=Psychrilyobacter piezotolerans TaxID=2293438 RepID=A0ABX9KI25_9FUSO|nr:hypothetical protein [Psychrilyobacter piezotolerans]RDE63007.1 hypothetical protein DV867_05930 [Psychrilyobacter sp. S5]REI41765.1 hypothetical protein DYH56_05930 [Psychrilyobacter piezotolerans]
MLYNKNKNLKGKKGLNLKIEEWNEENFEEKLKKLDIDSDFLKLPIKESKEKLKGLKEKLFDYSDIITELLDNNFITSISEIFSYDNLKDDYRHDLISEMGIRVCPYCQRNYITNYINEKGDRTTADLDHFYPKSLYPYLALSLYNFIPSCQICNSRFKGSKDTYDKIINPYKNSFDDKGVKFETSETLIENILGTDIEFNIRFKNHDNVIDTIKMFGLDKVYKTSHNAYIRNMLENIEKSPNKYIENLGDNIFSELTSEERNEVIRSFKEIVKEPYKHRIEEGEPLGKLTKDILDEFGIDI